MITLHGTEVDNLVDYIDDIYLNGHADDIVGDTEHSIGWNGRVGRVVLNVDTQGNRRLDTFDNIEQAEAHMTWLDDIYGPPI